MKEVKAAAAHKNASSWFEAELRVKATIDPVTSKYNLKYNFLHPSNDYIQRSFRSFYI